MHSSRTSSAFFTSSVLHSALHGSHTPGSVEPNVQRSSAVHDWRFWRVFGLSSGPYPSIWIWTRPNKTLACTSCAIARFSLPAHADLVLCTKFARSGQCRRISLSAKLRCFSRNCNLGSKGIWSHMSMLLRRLPSDALHVRERQDRGSALEALTLPHAQPITCDFLFIFPSPSKQLGCIVSGVGQVRPKTSGVCSIPMYAYSGRHTKTCRLLHDRICYNGGNIDFFSWICMW